MYFESPFPTYIRNFFFFKKKKNEEEEEEEERKKNNLFTRMTIITPKFAYISNNPIQDTASLTSNSSRLQK